MVEAVQGTIVECNTAYGDATGGVRDNTESHLKLIEEHGWNKYFPVDLLDAQGPDVVWPIPHGKILKENHWGKNILHYDSMLVLAHFKGQHQHGIVVEDVLAQVVLLQDFPVGDRPHHID